MTERQKRGPWDWPLLGLLAGYAAVTLAVTLFHEPWRDEADTWLVARDLPLSQLIGWTRHAGTPALWYLLLKPLAALDLPFTAQSALHLLLAWTAASLFALTAPFERLTKILTLTSYYLFYEYSVVARSYVLTAIGLFVLAAVYKRRGEQPLVYATAVFFLANCNVHGTIFATLFLLLFLLDGVRGRYRPLAVAIMLSGLGAAWWQLRTPPGAAYPAVVRYVDGSAAVFAIGNAFIPGVPPSISFPIAAVLLVLILFALRGSPAALLFLTGSLAALTLLYTFVWMGGYQHSGLVFLITIAALWIGGCRLRREAAWLLNSTLLASSLFAMYSAVADVRFAFSGSKEMADYIRRERLDRYEIACHTPYHCVALAPHLGRKQIWYAGLQQHGTYLRWDRSLREAGYLPADSAISHAREHFTRERRPWLLVLNTPMGLPERRGFRLIYATTRPVFRMHGEKYWLYEPLPRN